MKMISVAIKVKKVLKGRKTLETISVGKTLEFEP